MKRIALVIAMTSLFCAEICANTYYSTGSFAPNDLNSWKSNRSGNGMTPSSFTSNGDIFVIQAGDVMVSTASWTFGNIGSALEIETGGVLQADHHIFFTGNCKVDNRSVCSHNKPF